MSFLAKAKYDEKDFSCDLSSRRLINPIQGTRLVAFLVTSFVAYSLLYWVASVFQWEKDDKKITDHYYHVLYLIILSYFIFSFANVNNTFSIYYILGMFVGGFTIAILGQLPGFGFSFGSLGSISGLPLATVLGLAGLIGYLAFLTWKKYKSCGSQMLFWVFLGVPIALVVLAFIFARIDSSTVEVHLHHWQWALALVFFARFPGVPLQSFLAGLFTGIMIDGIARYGPDPIFEPV